MRPRPQKDGVVRRLARLPALAVDCQSTGAPGRGHLLEVAWARLPADGAPAALHVDASYVALPAGARLSPRVRKLTGIAPADLVDAPTPQAVWQRLAGAVGARVLVAHFARFERPYLEALHAEHGCGGPFPLELICTHEIVCRLLPGLPRRGLRAVAGYLGHVMHGPRRAEAHVRATAAIWSAVALRLEREVGVSSLDELREWLASVPAQRRAGREFALPRTKRLELPDAPGVYRLCARGGEVLYVGKAMSLRSRVNSYFQKRHFDAERTPELLAQVFDVDVTGTASALEAALLETDEIKQRAPPYNRALLPRASEVWFVSEDLADAVPSADARHGIGPLPDRQVADALAQIRALLRDPARSENCWRSALGVRDDTPLDDACLGDGLRAFRRRHGLGADGGLDARRVLRLGAHLWRRQQVRRDERRAARRARRAAEGHPEPKKAQRRKRDWTVRRPEQVAAMLEGGVLRIAHWVRRAWWFLRVSDCALRWRPAARGAHDALRQVVFEQGRVVQATDVASGTALPIPVAGLPSRQQRLGAFDAATYDRLRVLTTELRRLVDAGCDIQICTSAQRTLDQAGLARRLRWI